MRELNFDLSTWRLVHSSIHFSSSKTRQGGFLGTDAVKARIWVHKCSNRANIKWLWQPCNVDSITDPGLPNVWSEVTLGRQFVFDYCILARSRLENVKFFGLHFKISRTNRTITNNNKHTKIIWEVWFDSD